MISSNNRFIIVVYTINNLILHNIFTFPARLSAEYIVEVNVNK